MDNSSTEIGPSLLEALKQSAAGSQFPQVVTAADRQILYTNGAFEHLCGHPAAEVVGNNPGELLQGPETNQEVVAIVRKMLGEKRPFEFRIENYHRDGHPYRAGVVVFPFQSDGATYFLGIERRLEGEEDLFDDPNLEGELRRAAKLIDQYGGY